MNSTMFNAGDILETIRMIQDECLDIRTTTMGISLLDCIDPDINKACDKVYDKITRKAEKLVETGEKIEKEYGIPIINKRIAVTPIAMLAAACPKENPVKFAKALQRAAETCGVNFVGGYSALVHKGFSAGDLELIRSIPEALDVTTRLCSSVNVGSTRSGINMDAVRIMGDIVLESAKLTADRQCVGPSKLVIFCNAPEDNPFMAGAFHGVGEPDCVINVGVSGPGVVRSTISKYPDASIDQIADIIKKTAFKITRMGQLVGAKASQMLGVPFGIVDLSLAPTPAGILRSAVPAVHHWCNVLSGTADAGICIGSCADRRRCGISAGSGRFLSAAQCFADLPVHSEELRQRRSECSHQFCFRSHQYHSECSLYFRYRLFPENGYRRCCHCNSYRQGH